VPSGRFVRRIAVPARKLSPDGQRVLTIEGSTVQLRDALSGQLVAKLSTALDSPDDIDFSPDGRWVLMTTPEVCAWDARTGRPVGRPIPQKGGFFVPADLSPDGQRMALMQASDVSLLKIEGIDDADALNTSVRILNSATGHPVGAALSLQGSPALAQFSPDGRRLVTASEEGALQLWDAFTGQPLGEPMSAGEGPGAIELSRDGQRLLVRLNFEMQIWDLPSGSPTDAEKLADLAEAVGGYTFNERGAMVPLLDQAERLARLHQEAARAKGGEPTASSFLRWFLADPWERTISPLSQVKVPDYIRQLLSKKTDEARLEAERAFPGHPLLAPQ
jgi:WD40 repeat protein